MDSFCLSLSLSCSLTPPLSFYLPWALFRHLIPHDLPASAPLRRLRVFLRSLPFFLPSSFVFFALTWIRCRSTYYFTFFIFTFFFCSLFVSSIRFHCRLMLTMAIIIAVRTSSTHNYLLIAIKRCIVQSWQPTIVNCYYSWAWSPHTGEWQNRKKYAWDWTDLTYLYIQCMDCVYKSLSASKGCYCLVKLAKGMPFLPLSTSTLMS